MSAAWLDADAQVLLRLAHLVDEEAREPGALAAEIRQLEDRFGLSPLARRKLEWEVHDAAEPTDAPRAGMGSVHRLRAVDPGGSAS